MVNHKHDEDLIYFVIDCTVDLRIHRTLFITSKLFTLQSIDYEYFMLKKIRMTNIL